MSEQPVLTLNLKDMPLQFPLEVDIVKVVYQANPVGKTILNFVELQVAERSSCPVSYISDLPYYLSFPGKEMKGNEYFSLF